MAYPGALEAAQRGVRVRVVEPGEGYLACGMTGPGRLAEIGLAGLRKSGNGGERSRDDRGAERRNPEYQLDV